MQVSRSKKWESKIALDEQGNPLLTAKGKKVLRTSYSVLQDNFFNYMKAAGYTDVERGERGSTEEHLTVTQFKVAQEKQRLETMTAQIAHTEQTLNNTQAAIEKKEKELKSLQKQAKEQRTAALTVQEIRSMGKRPLPAISHSLHPSAMSSRTMRPLVFWSKRKTAAWKKSCAAPNGVPPSGNRDTMPCTTHTKN